MPDAFTDTCGDERGLGVDENARRDQKQLLAALCAAATAVAVPDIINPWDILVLSCEEYDLNFTPDDLTQEQRQAILAAWRAALPNWRA
jgi:hypothetical protein